MNLPDLVNNRREIRLQPVAEREAAIIAYRIILVALLREIRAEVNLSVLPAYRSDQLQQDQASWFEALKAVAGAATGRALDKVRTLFQRESDSHLKRLVRSIKRGTKVDVPPAIFLHNRREAKLAQDYIEKNASLIKSLSDEAVKKVERAIYDGKVNGTTMQEMRDQLKKDFNISAKRAELIAVDQMASLNADMSRMRFEEIGVESYRWRTQRDGRVRPLHQRLEGRLYRWDETTDAEGGLHAGKPVRCRCRSAPILPAQEVTRSNRAANDPAFGETTRAVGTFAARTGFAAGLLAGLSNVQQ